MGMLFRTVLAILALGMLKVCSVQGQEHCIGPIEPLQLTAVHASPNMIATRRIQIDVRSSYKLWTDMRLKNVPISFKDDGGDIIVKHSKQGDIDIITVESKRLFDRRGLDIGLYVDHPCNTLAIWINFEYIKTLFDAGIPIPMVTEMPKRGYKLNIDDSFTLRFSYRNRQGLFEEALEGRFSPAFSWFKTNIAYAIGEGPSRFRNTEPKHFDSQVYSETDSDGFTTTTSKVEAQLGHSMPLDGAVLNSMSRMRLNSTKYPNLPDLSFNFYVFTSIHFKLQSHGIPVAVRSLNWESFGQVHQLDFQKGDDFNLLKIGLNYRVTPGTLGLSCIAVGIETAPSIAVARSTFPINSTTSKVTDVKLVDMLLNDAAIGTVSFGEFLVDLPLGAEADYIFSASTGKEITTTVIKVFTFIPISVNVSDAAYNQTDLHEATCTATGYPIPTTRLFLVPDNLISYGEGFDDSDVFVKEYARYEISKSSDNVTSSVFKEEVRTTVSYRMTEEMVLLRCFASNAYDKSFGSSYVNRRN